MHFPPPHPPQCQLYSLVSQLDEAVNLLGRDLRLELLLIDDHEELGPRNLAKALRIKLIEYISPFIFQQKLLCP